MKVAALFILLAALSLASCASEQKPIDEISRVSGVTAGLPVLVFVYVDG